MIEIGSFIKLQRNKQEMTLGELSDGIVSVSYLSKIENQKTQASPEIIQMLCNRLGIEVDNSQEDLIRQRCSEWYGMLFDSHDKDDIVEHYQEIQELMDKNLSESLMMFEIHKIRYFLVLNELELALKKINELGEISNSFDNEQQYYWYKFKGNYYSLVEDFSQAMYMYKNAEDKLQHVRMDEKEVADLKYVISITHTKFRNTLEAIEYANKALDIFMKDYNFTRCAQCHNLLGISYRRIRLYDKSIKNFNLALHLGKLEKNTQLIQLTNQNLGYLYSARGNSEQAIVHYKEVLSDSEVYIVTKLAAISSLIKELYNTKNYKETKERVESALVLLESFESIDSDEQFYVYVIYTYKYLLENNLDKFVSHLTTKFIPYLQKKQDYAELSTYLKLLANHYESVNKYKLAANYYKEATFAYEQISNI
ncbi:helix-turn-helix domain-containing protein [Oceanobacillus kimchii]|uniref:helix-turn-helix domain-containing protein n=1 Tax=Oceanobacillus kimchii TaxID=746691 RepID=UPI00034DE6B1|nr:helix-turn-helix domain-containing protein [Oceanobacillus kimchii]MCT1578886.1 helix-turn-helix domain-containing protein [Oceanobacillus kimchii]MCT2137811.1 helix-turn-helix domain-containing protein [Oceanobacillus kimchii]